MEHIATYMHTDMSLLKITNKQDMNNKTCPNGTFV